LNGKDINHPLSRDILTAESYKNIIRKIGLDDDKSTMIILDGDFNNWFAAFAFWVFKYYGYENLKLLNGVRKNGLMKTDLFQRKQLLFLQGSSTSLNFSSLIQKSGFIFKTSKILL